MNQPRRAISKSAFPRLSRAETLGRSDRELGALALRNRKTIFNLLFSAAAHTLLELGRDEQLLGAQLGVTTVLHTWTRDLRFHPHVHCIVTGGGLAPDGNAWIPARRRFLFPVCEVHIPLTG